MWNKIFILIFIIFLNNKVFTFFDLETKDSLDFIDFTNLENSDFYFLDEDNFDKINFNKLGFNLFEKLKVHSTFRFYQDNQKSFTTYYVDEKKFQNPFYLYNRTKISINNLSFGYLFIKRPFEIEVSHESFKYFLKKYYLELNSFLFKKIIFGSYKLGFGYGVVFKNKYFLKNFLDSNIKQKISADLDVVYNKNLFGFVIQNNFKDIQYSIFYSDKDLILKTSSYFVSITEDEFEKPILVSYSNEDLVEARTDDVLYDNTLFDYDIGIATSTLNTILTNKVRETLIGFNLFFPKESLSVGFCGYLSRYNKIFDPDTTYKPAFLLFNKYHERFSYIYRGDSLALLSSYFEYKFFNLKFFGEIAKSQSFCISSTTLINTNKDGFAVNLGFYAEFKNYKFYLFYINLDETFYSPLGGSFSIYDFYNNQQSINFLHNFNFKNLKLDFLYCKGNLFKGIWTANVRCETPRYPSDYNFFSFKLKYNFDNFSLNYGFSVEFKEKYINLKTYGFSQEELFLQTKQKKVENKYEIVNKIFKNLDLSFEYTKKILELYQNKFLADNFSFCINYKIKSFKILTKFTIFDVDKNITLTMVSANWYNLYNYDFFENLSGEKIYFSISKKFFDTLNFYINYEHKFYIPKNEYFTKTTESLLKLQLDFFI